MFGHGKNAKVYVAGYDLTNYLNSIETPKTADTAETSTFGGNTKTYIPGLVDATMQAEGFFDGSASAVDEVLNSIFGVNGSLWSWYPQGDAVGGFGYGLKLIKNSYNIMATIDDACKISIGGQSIEGRDRIVSLHALGEETASGNGTAVDNGAATLNGAVAYIQAPAVTGTVAVKIQHSTNNSVWVDLMSFTDVSADNTAERITVAGTVNRYVRVVWTLDEAESLTFNIGLARL